MLRISHLLTLADEYERAVAVGDTTLSFRVFGDSKKLTALRGSADITTGRFNDALIWFASNWPEGTQWPDGVERPEPVEAEPDAKADEAAA
jgi:hypothetical protein